MSHDINQNASHVTMMPYSNLFVLKILQFGDGMVVLAKKLFSISSNTFSVTANQRLSKKATTNESSAVTVSITPLSIV
jgi:hypothetical protein